VRGRGGFEGIDARRRVEVEGWRVEVVKVAERAVSDRSERR
jgi:hypothetical protein